MDAARLKDFRDGVHAVEDCISNLNRWEKEIKKEDERLLTLHVQNKIEDCPQEYPIRSQVSSPIISKVADNSEKKKNESKKPPNGKTKIHAYDYAAWDKYDAEAEVKKIDDVNNEQQKKRLSPTPGPTAARLKQRKQATSDACPASTDEDKIKALKLKDEGNGLFSAGKFQDAVNTYTAGLELDSSNHILHANRAMAYIKLDEGRAAERDCDACISLAPAYLKAYLRRGLARLMQGKLRLALLDYNEVLQMEPWNKDAKTQVAEIQHRLDAPPELHPPSTDFRVPSATEAPIALTSKPLQKIEVIEVKKESQIPPFIVHKSLSSSPSDVRLASPASDTQASHQPNTTSKGPAVANTPLRNADSTPDSSSSCAPLPPAPRTSHQFMTAWSKVTAVSHDSAIQWLQGVKPALLHKFELETECVASVVHHLLLWRRALCDQQTVDFSLVDDYVIAFAQSRGFDLQILFLEDQQKKDLLELWELLESSHPSLPQKLVEIKQTLSTL
ncbi:RNA-polymerase II-associated protein 3-like C-terminal domain [Trinorchestia longiramus]|nr:RNA-polymerase II-associated protein 3-like C-terminal domain [Trinorchestia longiramus]